MQTVAEAAKDLVFAQNPNDLTIGYSSTSEDDEELDDDDDSMTSNSNSMTSNSTGDDAEEDSSAEDVADPHNYAKLVDSNLF